MKRPDRRWTEGRPERVLRSISGATPELENQQVIGVLKMLDPRSLFGPAELLQLRLRARIRNVSPEGDPSTPARGAALASPGRETGAASPPDPEERNG